MQGKIMFVLGAAVGYVVGTRSGREAYDRLKSQATEFWQDPRVQQKVSEAQEFAKEKIPAVGEKVSQAARKGGEGKGKKSSSNAGSRDNDVTTSTTETGGTTPTSSPSPDVTTPATSPGIGTTGGNESRPGNE